MLTPSNSLSCNRPMSPEDAIAELSIFLGWNDHRLMEEIQELKTKDAKVVLTTEERSKHQRIYVSVVNPNGTQSTTCIILQNSKEEENPIYIQGTYPVGTMAEYKEAERVKCLSDLERVGPKKPLGWMAIKSLIEVGQIGNMEQYRVHLAKNGVKTLLLTFEESGTASGALFAYHEETLKKMLDKNQALLQANNWPTEPVAFIYYLKNEAPRGTDLFNFIADLFSDFNNDGRKPTAANPLNAHGSFEAMSLPEKKKYLAEGINGITRDLGRGMHGNDVLMLQNALLILGYMTVAPNGNFGPKTEDALVRFKLANNLATDPNDIKTKRFGKNTKKKIVEMLSTNANVNTTTTIITPPQSQRPGDANAEEPVHQPQKKPSESSHPKKSNKNAILALGTAAVLAIGALTHDKIEGLFKKSEKAPVTKPEEKHIDEPPRDPNRPEFLDQERVKLEGLNMLMAFKDHFDKYIFNTVTGNRAFAQTLFITKDVPFNFKNRPQYKFPYHAFIFKPFDERTNTKLPPRIGKVKGGQRLVDLFNDITIYKANNPKDIEAIKAILVTSFDFSFNIQLNPNAIEIAADEKGKINTIRYKDSNAKNLSVETTLTGKTEKDERNTENRYVTETKDKKFKIVDDKGNLRLPPSIMEDQGIAIPPSALPEYKEVAYEQHFTSGGKKITIPIKVEIATLIEQNKALRGQGRVERIKLDEGSQWINPGLYILDNDPFAKDIANQITEKFKSKKDKMRAIVDFVHSFYYVPDAYEEAPKSLLMSLLSRGGDCEDSSIMTATLARAVGIDCVFIYLPDHQAIACDIDGPGTAFELEGRKYEWVETTGGPNRLSYNIGSIPPRDKGKMYGVSRIDGTEMLHPKVKIK